MSTQYEVAIRGDGTMVHRQINESPTCIPPNMLADLAKSAPHYIKSLLSADQVVGAEWQGYYGLVALRTTPEIKSVIVAIKTLNLRAAVQILEGAIVCPKFVRDSGEPAVPFQWAVPKHMRLFFGTDLYWDPSNLVYYQDKSYLFALDSKGNAYKLPTSNVHEDCQICMGTYNSRGRTLMESLRASLEQFLKSEWNKDLSGNVSDRHTYIFRFKPKAGDHGFEQLPMESETSWMKYCQKVATPLLMGYKEVIA